MRKFSYIPWLLLYCWLLPCGKSIAQQVQHTALRNNVFIGEPLEMQTMISSLPPKAILQRLPMPDSAGSWHLTGSVIIDSTTVKHQVTIRYQIVCFDSGSVPIEFYPLNCVINNQSVSITSKPLAMQVLPVPIGQMAQLHPPQLLVPPTAVSPNTVFWWMLFSVCMAVLVAVLVFKRFRRKATPKLGTAKSIEQQWQNLFTQSPKTQEEWATWANEVYEVLYAEFPTLYLVIGTNSWPAEVPSSLQSLYNSLGAILFSKAIPRESSAILLEPLVNYFNQKNR